MVRKKKFKKKIKTLISRVLTVDKGSIHRSNLTLVARVMTLDKDISTFFKGQEGRRNSFSTVSVSTLYEGLLDPWKYCFEGFNDLFRRL